MNLTQILKHNVIGKLLNHVIVFAINVFLVRLLGASLSGSYFNELYVLNFVVFIFSAGLDYSAIALISKDPALLPRIHKMLLKTVFVFTAVILFYVFVVLPYSNNYFKQPSLSIVLFSIGNLLLIFYQGVLSALKKFNRQNLILLITNSIFLAYLIVLAKDQTAGNVLVISKSSIQYIVIIYACLFLLQGVLMWMSSLSPSESSGISISWNVFIRSGIYIMFSSLIYFLFLRIDNFFVQKYADGTTLGNYVQCGKIGQYFLYFSSVISSTLLPFISSETIGNSFTEWKRMMRPYILLLFLAALLIALPGKLLFPLIFGPAFNDMHSFIIILLPGYLCLGMLTLINAVYIGKGNIRKIITGDLIGLIMVASFDAWLVPRYGAYAAAFISSIAYITVFLYLLIDFKKQFYLPVKFP